MACLQGHWPFEQRFPGDELDANARQLLGEGRTRCRDLANEIDPFVHARCRPADIGGHIAIARAHDLWHRYSGAAAELVRVGDVPGSSYVEHQPAVVRRGPIQCSASSSMLRTLADRS